ncbi:hypothetical protein [uncultured Maribacter sp.]|uniref:hypothetical protein n=1 Tax=uncultured Maribacter sp. TaxID=431308 RepID=UPI00260F3A6F|nr:hypothetical protein [uncultured Maribacter sp.]
MKKWLEEVRAPKMYRYLFYTMVRWAKSWNNDSPAFSSMLLMTTTFGFYAFFLFALFDLITAVSSWDLFIEGFYLYSILTLFLITGFTSYFLFYHNDKFLQIEKEFVDENEKQRKLGSIYLFLYLFISFSSIYIGGWFLTFHNPNYN